MYKDSIITFDKLKSNLRWRSFSKNDLWYKQISNKRLNNMVNEWKEYNERNAYEA